MYDKINTLYQKLDELEASMSCNIRDEGLRILQTSGTGDKACRPDVRRNSGGRKKSTITHSVGQEATVSAEGGRW